MKRLKTIGILLQFIGLILILLFQFFMQEIYTHKTTLSGHNMILVLMPENRSILWAGYILLFAGFILIVFCDFKDNTDN